MPKLIIKGKQGEGRIDQREWITSERQFNAVQMTLSHAPKAFEHVMTRTALPMFLAQFTSVANEPFVIPFTHMNHEIAFCLAQGQTAKVELIHQTEPALPKYADPKITEHQHMPDWVKKALKKSKK